VGNNLLEGGNGMPIQNTDHTTYRDFKEDKGFKINGYDIEVDADPSIFNFDSQGRLSIHNNLFFTNVGELIPPGTDLRTITKLGNYRGFSGSTFINAPQPTGSFQLIVGSGLETSGVNYQTQTAIYSNGKMYISSKVNDVWTAWDSIITASGGTMTGVLRGTTINTPFVLVPASDTAASFLIWLNSTQTGDFARIGKLGTNNDLGIRQTGYGTDLILKSDRVTANKNVYVGSDRLVKLSELNYTAVNISANIAGFNTFIATKSAKSVTLIINSGSVFQSNRGSGTVLGTLPVGYRPVTSIFASLHTDAGNPSNNLITINTAGKITLISINSGNSNVYLGNISYQTN
jgi:hypothetical protein